MHRGSRASRIERRKRQKLKDRRPALPLITFDVNERFRLELRLPNSWMECDVALTSYSYMPETKGSDRFVKTLGLRVISQVQSCSVSPVYPETKTT
jgi:hypothetical protein